MDGLMSSDFAHRDAPVTSSGKRAEAQSMWKLQVLEQRLRRFIRAFPFFSTQHDAASRQHPYPILDPSPSSRFRPWSTPWPPLYAVRSDPER